jgi:hypothetical protein
MLLCCGCFLKLFMAKAQQQHAGAQADEAECDPNAPGGVSFNANGLLRSAAAAQLVLHLQVGT